MRSGVGADGSLHIGEADILASHQTVGHIGQCEVQSLGVHRVITVGRSAVALRGEGLADSPEVVLQVHLDEFEDGLALEGRWGLVGACGHDGIGTGVRFAATCYVGDTVDGTACFTAWADLFDLCHFFKV